MNDLTVILAQDISRKRAEVRERIAFSAMRLFGSASFTLYEFPYALNAFGLMIESGDVSVMAKFDSDTGNFLGFMTEEDW